MKLKDDELERAEARVSAEVAATIAATTAALEASGTPVCIDCGGQIEPARKAVLRSACRCIECQRFYEQEKFHK